MEEIQMYEMAYLIGIDAYNAGIGYHQNPFPVGSQENSFWINGYSDALNKIWLKKDIVTENNDESK